MIHTTPYDNESSPPRFWEGYFDRVASKTMVKQFRVQISANGIPASARLYF